MQSPRPLPLYLSLKKDSFEERRRYPSVTRRSPERVSFGRTGRMRTTFATGCPSEIKFVPGRMVSSHSR